MAAMAHFINQIPSSSGGEEEDDEAPASYVSRRSLVEQPDSSFGLGESMDSGSDNLLEEGSFVELHEVNSNVDEAYKEPYHSSADCSLSDETPNAATLPDELQEGIRLLEQHRQQASMSIETLQQMFQVFKTQREDRLYVQNAELQAQIEKYALLVSQVPTL